MVYITNNRADTPGIFQRSREQHGRSTDRNNENKRKQYEHIILCCEKSKINRGRNNKLYYRILLCSMAD